VSQRTFNGDGFALKFVARALYRNTAQPKYANRIDVIFYIEYIQVFLGTVAGQNFIYL